MSADPRPLEIGYYVPTRAFLAIPEHVAVMEANGALVALTGPSGDAASDAEVAEARRYARLIVAAPELLESLRRAHVALEEAGNHFDHDNPRAAQEALAKYFELWSDDTRAAIVKAEGRS